MWTDTVESAPGTVTQVRSSAQILIRYRQAQRERRVILVGHVTKDGQIAGPRVVEHMVDAVLSFEGDGAHHFRILRAQKNRFGPTDEIGVFEMTGLGLRRSGEPVRAVPVRTAIVGAPGTAVYRRHGRHAPGAGGDPGARRADQRSARRAAPWSAGTRAGSSMVLAVLEAHCGVKLDAHDVYLNVAGGFRINEPAADLAAAAALVSSLAAGAAAGGRGAISAKCRCRVRSAPCAQSPARLKEAAKLGFQRAFLPIRGARMPHPMPVFPLSTHGNLASLVADIAARGGKGRMRKEVVSSTHERGELR